MRLRDYARTLNRSPASLHSPPVPREAAHKGDRKNTFLVGKGKRQPFRVGMSARKKTWNSFCNS